MPRRSASWEAFEDSDLVSRAREGDAEAFAELVNRHRNWCLRVAYGILRNYEDAEDEVQNAFWRAYEHLADFHGDAKFSTWLNRILVNQALMRLRKRKTQRTHLSQDLELENSLVPLAVPDPSASPEEDLAERELAELLQKESQRIPPLLRSVFLMRDVEQVPIEQVAEFLGTSVAAAKSRLLRARAEMRERLRKHEGRRGLATLMA
jgi:RNA polymerase sigma-70 factor (ECF subfamily)